MGDYGQVLDYLKAFDAMAGRDMKTMNEIKLTIHTFEMDTLKEATKKVQEEAGEAFAEYVILQEQQDRGATRLADEIADVIQASCNLAARYNINLQGAMERCEKRNRERGRYGDADTNGIRESSVGDTANRRWMDSDSGGNNSPACACDRSGVVDSDGSRDAHYKTAKSPAQEMRIARLEKSNDWLISRCGDLEERVSELSKQVNRVAIIEQGLRNRGMHDMADEFADFHDVTEDAYAAFLALLESDDGE